MTALAAPALKALRAQVLSALRELLRAFEAADRGAAGGLLRGHDRGIYPGLVSVLLRMVFVLFAEAHGLLPLEDERYAASYGLSRLHAALTAGGEIGDGHGAWARVLALFRLLHEGSRGALSLPPHRGRIFDPATHPFLEEARIPDVAVLRVLDLLLVLDGERLSYRDLDVEHVGSVHEDLMGLDVDVGPDRALSLQPSEERRRSGAHYTSRAITRIVVERALAPLLRDDAPPDAILALRVCDPAMGSGAFLVEACRQLAEHLVRAWTRSGHDAHLPPDAHLHARRLIARRCLYGVDRNPLAVDLARLSLWLVTAAREQPFTFVDRALRHGDALVGLTRDQIASGALGADRGSSPTATRALLLAKIEEAAAHAAPSGPRPTLRHARHAPLARSLDRADEALRRVRAAGDLVLAAFLGEPSPPSLPRARPSTPPERRARARAMDAAPALVARILDGATGPETEALAAALRARYAPFHWEIELPEVFAEGRDGFDALIGNPPWVSYAGRAAQPLAGELRELYAATSPAFAGYRNLQGVFVHRAASLLRPGGRLGLVLPTSMSDLGGYGPSRRAHDALSVCDDALPDFGDRAFEGVFQPSMALLSTRRPAPVPLAEAAPWPLQRTDLDEETIALLGRLGALPRLPPHLFGERGFQTTGDDVKQIHELEGPTGAFTTGVRVGGDVEPFRRRPPRRYCDPLAFGGRLRPAAVFREVKILIRQTARFPMAAASDGGAFRNSILAGFADDDHSEHLLLAYLNSSPVRFYHYMRHRDARQGMPQLKIAHLRALPAPPRGSPAFAALEGIGRELGARNTGVSPAEQATIDAPRSRTSWGSTKACGPASRRGGPRCAAEPSIAGDHVASTPASDTLVAYDQRREIARQGARSNGLSG